MSLFDRKPQPPQDNIDPMLQTAPIKPKMSHNARIVVTFVAVFLVAMVLLFIYIRLTFSSLGVQQAGPKITGTITGTFNMISKGVLQYNNSRSLVYFTKVHYSLFNSANTTALLTVFNSNPDKRIYFLDTGGYCVNCFIPSSLYYSLNKSLSQYGVLLNSSSLNYVAINKMDSIPKSSIIIIASGLIPNILLPGINYTNLCKKYSNSTMLTLLSNGDTLIYVGANFTRSVSCSGQTVQTPTPSLNALGFYNATSGNSSYQSLLYLKNISFKLPGSTLFGSAQAVSTGQNGTLILLANYPSVGWQNNYTLSQDIARVIASRFWIKVIANGSTILPGANYSSSNFTIFTTNLVMPNGPGVTGIINSSYPLVRVVANNSVKFAQYDVPTSIRFRQNGVIGMPTVVGVGARTQLITQVFNTSNKVSVITGSVYNSNIKQLKNISVNFGQIGPARVYSVSSFPLPTGYYLLNLTDQNGNLYSSALFYVAPANVTPLKLDFRNGTFLFSVESNGAPVSEVPYSIGLSENPYNGSGYISNGVLRFSLPSGTAVSYGKKSFTINILGNIFQVNSDYEGSGFRIPPLYIEAAIEVAIIFIITRFLTPPDIDEYYIDVPDIKPVQRQVLKENVDAMTDIFEKVNTYYHWKNMPLTVDEVRTGISNYLRYGNMKISVTGRNSYVVLSKLVSRGLVEETGDYYALKKWIANSGHSMEYLVIYRKLRDFCVSNAMLFTELDSTAGVDMIVTNKSTQNFIKIYSPDMKVKELDIKQGSRMFIAFINEEAKQTFLDKVYDSYGTNDEILKMAIGYGNIKLIDTDHLDDLKLR